MTTKTNIALAELAEKGADTDPLKQMIQFVAQRMMERDAESLCAAAYGERSPERLNSRNGCRERRVWPDFHIGRRAEYLAELLRNQPCSRAWH